MEPPPPRSTRLENLRFAPGAAHVEFEGKPVEFAGAGADEAIRNFQAFYWEALKAYEARPALARAGRGPETTFSLGSLFRPSTWIRAAKNLFGRFLGSFVSPPAPPSARAAAAPAAPAPASPEEPTARAERGKKEPAAKSAKAAPQPVKGEEAEETATVAPPARAKRAAGAEAFITGAPADSSASGTAPEPSNGASAKAKPDGPALRAAYADERGVHLLWLGSPGEKNPQPSELVCTFDSAVAARLQDCYTSLARMGHPVVDLQVWRKAPHVEAASGEAGEQLPSAALEAEKPSAAPKSDPPLTDKSIVMRLHPGPSDPPGRAVVSPAGDEKSLQVLAAPERLIDALHAAADPGRPAPERLTYLRCTPGRSGLKVIAVGLGEDKSQPRTPSRWENVSSWWEAAKKNPAPAPAPSTSRRPAGGEPAAPSPALPKPQPELF